MLQSSGHARHCWCNTQPQCVSNLLLSYLDQGRVFFGGGGSGGGKRQGSDGGLGGRRGDAEQWQMDAGRQLASRLPSVHTSYPSACKVYGLFHEELSPAPRSITHEVTLVGSILYCSRSNFCILQLVHISCMQQTGDPMFPRATSRPCRLSPFAVDAQERAPLQPILPVSGW